MLIEDTISIKEMNNCDDLEGWNGGEGREAQEGGNIYNDWLALLYNRNQHNSSGQFSRSVVSDSSQHHELQHARPPCPSATPGVHPNPCPLSWWCHPTTSSSVAPSPPALNLSQHQGLVKWVSSSHEVAKVLEFQLQHQSFQWTARTDLLYIYMTDWRCCRREINTTL